MNSISKITSLLLISVLLVGCSLSEVSIEDRIILVLEEDLLIKADQFLKELPVTVTADICDRSEGDSHDFYSEGDYWWPDPENPDGPYIQKDGLTNPDNFVAHRESLIQFSEMVGTLTSAYLITKKDSYAEAALTHCR
ncbi:MAG: hypothetical protein ACJA08_003039, partial [Cyclobacteriaceae bacterium]